MTRSADDVMAIAALGAVKPHRLSFARILVRTMVAERWELRLVEMDVDRDGVGRVVYSLDARGHRLHFVIRSDDVPEELRTGRLSESRFDGMGILLDGPLDAERLVSQYESQRLRIVDFGIAYAVGGRLQRPHGNAFVS